VSRTPRELALEWREALVGRDATRFAGLFALDAVFEDVEHRTADGLRARAIHGRAAIEELTRGWLAAIPAFEYDVLDVLADERTAAVRWRYATPGLDELEGLSWLTCADGFIERAFVVFDSHALIAAEETETSAAERASLRRWVEELEAAGLAGVAPFDVRRPP
jgi:hypothetical protein